MTERRKSDSQKKDKIRARYRERHPTSSQDGVHPKMLLILERHKGRNLSLHRIVMKSDRLHCGQRFFVHVMDRTMGTEDYETPSDRRTDLTLSPQMLWKFKMRPSLPQ